MAERREQTIAVASRIAACMTQNQCMGGRECLKGSTPAQCLRDEADSRQGNIYGESELDKQYRNIPRT